MQKEIPTTEAVRRRLPAPFEVLAADDIEQIHKTSMRVLDKIGIAMPHEDALRVFKDHGARVEGDRVYLTESQVMEALREIPKQFRLCARNSDRDVTVGSGEPIFAPGYGAPFLVDADEGKRSPTLEDYSKLAKISHELPNQDVSGYLLVEPDGVPQAHLHMLHAHMVHSDKPFMGSTDGAEGARQTLDMARIAFEGDLGDRAVTISLVTSIGLSLVASPTVSSAAARTLRASSSCHCR